MHRYDQRNFYNFQIVQRILKKNSVVTVEKLRVLNSSIQTHIAKMVILIGVTYVLNHIAKNTMKRRKRKRIIKVTEGIFIGKIKD